MSRPAEPGPVTPTRTTPARGARVQSTTEVDRISPAATPNENPGPAPTADEPAAIAVAAEASAMTTTSRRTGRAYVPAAGRSIALGVLLLGEKACEPEREDGEEDDRLLGRHRHAAELLVVEAGQAPQPLGRAGIRVVDRLRYECQHEPERRREHEAGEHVGGARTARQCVRRVLPDAPPPREA